MDRTRRVLPSGLPTLSLATTIRLGLVSMAVFSGIVGIIGFRGLNALGTAVNQTAAASDIMAGVNAAAGSVATFVLTPDERYIRQAKASLDGAVKAVDGVGDAESVSRISENISAFRGVIDALGTASGSINTAAADLASATGSLQQAAAAAEDASGKKADAADREVGFVQIDLTSIRSVGFNASTVQSAAHEIKAALIAYSRQPDDVLLGKAQSTLVLSRPAMDDLARLAGWPSTQKYVEKLGKRFAELDATLQGLDNFTAEKADTAIAAANAIVQTSGAFLASLSAAALADEEARKAREDERSKARVVAGMVRNFSDRMKSGVHGADRYRLTPTDDNAALARKALSQADSFGKMLERLDHPELRQGLSAVSASFEQLVTAKTSFDAATESALQTSRTASDLITEIAHSRQVAAESERRSSTMIMMATGVAVLVMALVIAALLARMVIRPIRQVTDSMHRLARGDTALTIDAGRSDEIGAMMASVAVFRDNAVERLRLEGERIHQEERQHLRQAHTEELIQSFRQEMSTILTAVTQNADQMQLTADVLNQVAERSSTEAQSAARSSREASVAVQTVAASADELAASISEINGQVRGAMRIVEATSDTANATSTKTGALVEAATRIGDVVSLIRSIAGQTNLLALNATIEAARAGESGKGFAVVAGEVKLLATQTSRATDEIAAQIDEIQAATRTVVAAIDAISSGMGDVRTYTASIAAAVEQQGPATTEIASSVGEAANGTDSASQSVELLSQSVEETSKSATHVLQVSSDLNTQATRVRTVLDRFLTDVAAA